MACIGIRRFAPPQSCACTTAFSLFSPQRWLRKALVSASVWACSRPVPYSPTARPHHPSMCSPVPPSSLLGAKPGAYIQGAVKSRSAQHCWVHFISHLPLTTSRWLSLVQMSLSQLLERQAAEEMLLVATCTLCIASASMHGRNTMLHECSEKEWKGNILGTTRDVPVSPQAERVQLQSTTPWRTPKSMLFSHSKNERKMFQPFVKFPTPTPKHRRAGIIQRISLQCFLS